MSAQPHCGRPCSHQPDTGHHRPPSSLFQQTSGGHLLPLPPGWRGLGHKGPEKPDPALLEAAAQNEPGLQRGRGARTRYCCRFHRDPGPGRLRHRPHAGENAVSLSKSRVCPQQHVCTCRSLSLETLLAVARSSQSSTRSLPRRGTGPPGNAPCSSLPAWNTCSEGFCHSQRLVRINIPSWCLKREKKYTT